MALEDTPSIISYVGNNTAFGDVEPVAYALPFVFFSDDHISLYIDGVLSTDGFVISGDKFAGTAEAVTLVAYTSSPVEQIVTWKREVPYDQPTVLPGSGRVVPAILEAAYDYGVMQIQQVGQEVARAPKAFPNDTPPGGSFVETPNTTVGQDANGDLVMRSAAEEVAFLGIGDEVAAAAASAAAALASEGTASAAASSASVDADAAGVSADAAAASLANLPASLSAKNVFEVYISADVGEILLTFDGGGVFFSSVGTFDQDQAALALADLINSGSHPVSAQATGRYVEVTAILQGDLGNGIVCGIVTGGAFGQWVNATTTGGELSGVVLSTAQTLTEPQKLQARENIGAIGLEVFNPLSLFASDNFTMERTIPAEIISQAKHCYFFDEASGDYIDQIGALDIPHTGAVNASVTAGRFRETRAFDGSTQYGVSAVDTARVGGPFWFVVGVNFTEVAGLDGVVGEGETDATASLNWDLYRSGTDLIFRVRRKDTTGLDTVTVPGISAGVDYVIVGRNDSTGLYLYVSEIGEAYGNASLVSGSEGYDLTQYPLNIGKAWPSATATNARMNGDLGFFAYGFGTFEQLSERSIDSLTRLQATDFATLKTDIPKTLQRFKALLAVGDSLTTETFADPNWSERATTLHDATWRAEVSGIGGQTSTPIATRFLSYPLSNIARKVVAFWMGNNNPASLQTVVDDVYRCVQRALLAGAEKVLILGLPNRSGFLTAEATVDALQVQHDFINAGFAAIAATDSRVEYLDVHTWFQTAANYTTTGFTLTANDLADIALGIVPRQMRDAPASSGSTHLGPDGADHLAYYVETFLPA